MRRRRAWSRLPCTFEIDRAIRGVTPALSACRRPLHRRLSESEKPTVSPQRSPETREQVGWLFRRCDLFDWRFFGSGFFVIFIGGVQEPIDQAGAALLHDSRGLGLLPILENFVISLVAHGILHLRSAHNSKATPQHSPQQAHRHDQDDCQRKLPAFVLRDEDEEDEESGCAEDEKSRSAALLLLESEVGPLKSNALGKNLVGKLLHAMQCRTSGGTRRRYPLHLGGRKKIVARHAVWDRVALELRPVPIGTISPDALRAFRRIMSCGVRLNFPSPWTRT